MPEKNIFVSHSKNDKEIIASFDHIFARTGVKSVCMEFENMNSPHWNDIRMAINFSRATFVLLGKNIKCSIYTKNWVAFEVGISCSMDKRVWVFEQQGSPIDFPIPYVTDYMLYEDLERKEVFNYIRTIIEGTGERTYFKAVDTPSTKIPTGKNIQCPNCQSTFAFHVVENFKFDSVNCPLCRQPIKMNKTPFSSNFSKYFG